MWKQETEEQEGRIRQSSSTKKRQSPQVITQQKQILSASCVGVGPLFDMTPKNREGGENPTASPCLQAVDVSIRDE